jgi:hypothetical protein
MAQMQNKRLKAIILAGHSIKPLAASGRTNPIFSPIQGIWLFISRKTKAAITTRALGYLVGKYARTLGWKILVPTIYVIVSAIGWRRLFLCIVWLKLWDTILLIQQWFMWEERVKTFREM